MTWQGGKLGRESGQTSAFAALQPMAGERDDAAAALESMAKALSDFPSSVRLNVRLMADDGESVVHWEVQGGSRSAKARKKEPKDADVIVVMRPETWLEIAQGRLAPYEAVYSGRMRVGGNMEMAKSITRHLTDPAATYLPPC